MHFRRKVLHGKKLGRKIGFPTLNLNIGNFADHYKPGVYSCRVKIGEQYYSGALHLGPQLNFKKSTLEIYVLNFNQTIYGQWINFEVLQKIRPTQSFKSLEALKEQIRKDVEKISQRTSSKSL